MARGRPRKMDPNDVLDTVMQVFWKRGFEDTSMNDLADASGMAKPGLYAAFGDKEALYATALEHYICQLAGPLLDKINRSTDPVHVMLRKFLSQVASFAFQSDGPKGCFVANNLTERASMPPPLQALGMAFDERRRTLLHTRFKAAKAQGELPPEADPEALAIFYSGQALALAVIARTGAANKRTMDRFIDVAMTALPLEKQTRSK